MRREDDLYERVIVVDHNRDPITPAAGSCIFLHRSDAARSPTIGCTAMAARDLDQLFRWLDPARGSVLVQLPRREWDARAAAWDLPPRF